MSLTHLEKGIQGQVVMTLELESIFTCIYDGRVPPAWEKVSACDKVEFSLFRCSRDLEDWLLKSETLRISLIY